MFQELEENGKQQLMNEGFDMENIRFDKRLAMRYPGQHFTLELPLRTSIEDLEETFYKHHQEVYRFAFYEPAMITDLIVNAYGSKPKSMLGKPLAKTKNLADALCEKRQVRFEGKFRETPVYCRDDVPVGSHLYGPVIFEELGSTTIVEPGWAAKIDDMGNLILGRN